MDQKEKNKKILHVAVDSEYTSTDFVSLQVSVRDGDLYPAKALFINKKFLDDELTDIAINLALPFFRKVRQDIATRLGVRSTRV